MKKTDQNQNYSPPYDLCDTHDTPNIVCGCGFSEVCDMCGDEGLNVCTLEKSCDNILNICYNCWCECGSFRSRNGFGHTWAENIEQDFRMRTINEHVNGNRKKISNKQRKRIYERDAYRCIYCGDYKSLVIDHIVPICKNGTNDDENLVTACQKCNSNKGAKKPSEWNNGNQINS